MNAIQNSIPTTLPRRTAAPRVDIFQSEVEVVLRADLPGVRPDDLEISVEKDVLSIRADVAEPAAPAEGSRLVHAEPRATRFERSFRLSSDLDTDRVDATLEDGVLRLAIARRNPKRTIEVQAR